MRFQLYRTLFVAFIFCEILLITSQRLRYMGQRENGIVLTLLAAAMGIFAVLSAFEKAKPREKRQASRAENWILGRGNKFFMVNLMGAVINVC